MPKGTGEPCRNSVLTIVRFFFWAFVEFLGLFWLGIVLGYFGILLCTKKGLLGEIESGFLEFWIGKEIIER